MTLDVVVLVVFAVLVYLGWRSGALSQVIRIAAALGVVFGSPFVARLVREALFDRSELAEPLVELASLFIAGLVIYTAVAVSGWLAIRTMRAASRTLSAMDRLAGAGIGAVKAALIVYFLVAGALLLMVPLENVDPDDRLHMRDGHATRLVEQYDVLAPWKFPRVAELHDFLEVGARLRDEGADAVDVPDAEELAELLRDERIAELLDDEELMQAVRDDRYARTVADPRIRDVVNDTDLWEEISKRTRATEASEPTRSASEEKQGRGRN